MSSADSEAATLDLAKQLIACPSVTPADGGCLDLVAARLGAAGFACERFDRGGVRNLWARRGQSAPLVCFAGHVDVVPPGPVERWTTDPFMPVVRGDFLFGRGAADMKASVAAMVVALERHVAAHPDTHPDGAGSLALLLTSDEEGDALHGTAAVVEALTARGIAIDYGIVGEPTCAERLGDTIKIGRRGSLTGALTVTGVQSHIAYPEHGRNPVHTALPALAELAATTWDLGDSHFGPTSFQISNVHAGTGAANIVPGSLDVLFNFRFSPASSPDALMRQVEDVLRHHDVEFEIRWTLGASPFFTPPGVLARTLAGAIERTTGVAPRSSTTGGTSDGRFLAPICRELVEFGPVNHSIHAIDEHVRVADLGPLCEIYGALVAALVR
ncbi:MAG: succinyl-diaminopimelate desuccinylase [Vicinamibacterales bacterium]